MSQNVTLWYSPLCSRQSCIVTMKTWLGHRWFVIMKKCWHRFKSVLEYCSVSTKTGPKDLMEDPRIGARNPSWHLLGVGVVSDSHGSVVLILTCPSLHLTPTQSSFTHSRLTSSSFPISNPIFCYFHRFCIDFQQRGGKLCTFSGTRTYERREQSQIHCPNFQKKRLKQMTRPSSDKILDRVQGCFWFGGWAGRNIWGDEALISSADYFQFILRESRKPVIHFFPIWISYYSSSRLCWMCFEINSSVGKSFFPSNLLECNVSIKERLFLLFVVGEASKRVWDWF